MSWTGINHSKGMPFGGMPADSILQKLEVTDEAYMPPGSRIEERDSFTGMEAKDAAIMTLLDRRPDPPFLSADQAKRNPQTSRQALHLRYNGTRGSSGDLPRHEHMFYGFTGDDPRGASTDPRFDKMREQMAHRARQLELRMSDSVGHDGGPGEAPHQEAERPWTGPALQKARVQHHVGARNRLKIFTASKDARSTNTAVAGGHAATAGRFRAWSAMADSSGEHWNEGAAGDPEALGSRPTESVLGHSRLLSGEVADGFVTGKDAPNASRGVHLSYASESTMALPVAKYSVMATGKTRASDAERSSAARSERSGLGQQQRLGLSKLGSGVRGGEGNRVLAAAMSAAAQSRRAENRQTVNDGVRAAPADGKANQSRAHSRQVHEGDVALAYYQATPDHAKAPGGERRGQSAVSGATIAHGVKASVSGAAQAMPWKSHQNHARSALATAIAQAVRNPGEHASTADTIKAAYESYAAGARHVLNVASVGKTAALARGRGVTPGDNEAAGGGFDSAKQQSSAAVHNAAASRGLEVANYSGTTPVEDGNLFRTNLRAINAANGGQEAALSAAAQHLQNQIMTQKHPEYVGATQTSGHVENHEQEFGLKTSRESAYSTGHGRLMGRKAVRYDKLAAAEGDGFDEDRLGGASQVGELVAGVA